MRKPNNMKGRYVIALVAMFAFAFVAAFGVSSSYAGTDYDENEGSFYKTASAARAFFDVMMNGGKVATDDIFENAPGGDVSRNVGNFSALMGYLDEDIIADPAAPPTSGGGAPATSWTTTASSTSKNTNGVSYSNKGSTDAKYASDMVAQYGVYGMTLQRLGLDATTGDNSSNVGRIILGNLLHGTYFVTQSVDGVMEFSIKGLQKLNPFGLFIGANTPTAVDDNYVEGGGGGGITSTEGFQFFDNPFDKGQSPETSMTGEDGSVFSNDDNDAIAKLRQWWRELYEGIYAMSMFIILPLMLAFAIVAYLITRTNPQARGNTKRFVDYGKRMLFLLFGIPLMGTLYTAFLDKAAGFAAGNDFDAYSSDRLILSTLVDFEGWAKDSGLGVYDGVVIEGAYSGATANSYYHLRESTYTINRTVGENLYGYGIGEYWDGMKVPEGTKDPSLSVEENENAGLSLGDIFYDEASGGRSQQYNNKDISDYANKLLSEYASGATFTGEAYEGYWREHFIDDAEAADGNSAAQALNNLTNWLVATGDPAVFATDLASLRYDTTGDKLTDVKATGVAFGADPGYLQLSSKWENVQSVYDKLQKAKKDGTENTEELLAELRRILDEEGEDKAGDNYGDAVVHLGATRAPMGAGGLTATASTTDSGATVYTYTSNGVDDSGLTPLGMYNYLNTVFKSGSMEVYSAAKSVNTQSRVAHYSVNFVGGGIVGIALWLNTFVLLLAISITGVVYGFGMLFSNVRRSISMLFSMPLAMMGGLRAIAHVLLLGLSLVAELIGSYGAYMVMRSVLVVINKVIVDNVLTRTLFSSFTGQAAEGTVTGTIMATSLGSVPAAGGIGIAAIATFVLSIIISVILFIVYIILAINLRRALVGAIDDAISAVLTRFVGDAGTVGAGGGGGLARGLFMGMAGSAASAGNIAKTVGALGAGGAGIGMAAQQIASGGDDIENISLENDNQTTSYDMSQDSANTSYQSNGGIEGDTRQDFGRTGSGGSFTGSMNGSLSASDGDAGQSSVARAEARTASADNVSAGSVDLASTMGSNALSQSSAQANADAANAGATSMSNAEGGDAALHNVVGNNVSNALNSSSESSSIGGAGGDSVSEANSEGGMVHGLQAAAFAPSNQSAYATAESTSGAGATGADGVGADGIRGVTGMSGTSGIAGAAGSGGEAGQSGEAYASGGAGGNAGAGGAGAQTRGVDVAATMGGRDVSGGAVYGENYDRDVQLTSGTERSVVAPSLAQTLGQTSGAVYNGGENVSFGGSGANVYAPSSVGTDGIRGVSVSGQPGAGGAAGMGGTGGQGQGGVGAGGTGGTGGVGCGGTGDVRGIAVQGGIGGHNLGEVMAANANIGHGHSETNESGMSTSRDSVRSVQGSLGATMSGASRDVSVGSGVRSDGSGTTMESGRSSGSVSTELKGARAQSGTGLVGGSTSGGTGGTQIYGDRGYGGLKGAEKSARGTSGRGDRKAAISAQQQAARDRFGKRSNNNTSGVETKGVSADLGQVFSDSDIEEAREQDLNGGIVSA